MSIEVTTETLGAVVARQSVVPQFLQELLEAKGAEATVEVTTRHTPFGNFLLGVKHVEKRDGLRYISGVNMPAEDCESCDYDSQASCSACEGVGTVPHHTETQS